MGRKPGGFAFGVLLTRSGLESWDDKYRKEIWSQVALGAERCGAQTPLHQEGGTRMGKNPLREYVNALGNFIYEWSWNLFITLTFKARFPISQNYLQSQWRRFISRINKEQRTDCYWVRSIETGREQDIPHLHALLGGTEVSPREIPMIWHPKTGNAKAEVYDPEQRAAWYIAKNPESVEFSENLTRPD